MKINTLTLRNIIKEELDSVIKEFKMPDAISTPEMPDVILTPEKLGFEEVKIDDSMVSQAEEMLSNVNVEGLKKFLKKNFPMEALTLKESIEKSLPQKKRTASEIITENVKIMKNDRMWQENFDQNIQELSQISKEDPSQRELINEWVKIFVFEKSKTWFHKNMPTITSFTKNSIEALKSFVTNDLVAFITPIVAMLILELSIVGTSGTYVGVGALFLGIPLGTFCLLLLLNWKNKQKSVEK